MANNCKVTIGPTAAKCLPFFSLKFRNGIWIYVIYGTCIGDRDVELEIFNICSSWLICTCLLLEMGLVVSFIRYKM